MKRKQGAHTIVFLYLIFGLAALALSAEPKDQIKETTDQILSILSDPSMKGPDKATERRKLIRREVDQRFDWEEMAKRSLAIHWAKRTPEEKKEFVDSFRELLARTYLDKVEGYSGEKVIYAGESIDGDHATARVKIITSKNQEIPIEYRLLKRGNNWVVYDVSVEGISFVNNYRTQFNSFLQKKSFQELVKRLRNKMDLKE